MEFTFVVEQSRVAGGEPIDVSISLVSDTARHVEISGWFLFSANGNSRPTERQILYSGKVGAGETPISVTMLSPNGPFDFRGKLFQQSWKVQLAVKAEGAKEQVAEAPIPIVPGALAASGATAIVKPNAPKPLTQSLISAFWISLTIFFVLFFFLSLEPIMTAVGFLAIWATISLAFTSGRVGSSVAALLHGGYEVEHRPDEVSLGESIFVTVRGRKSSLSQADNVRVTWAVDEVAFMGTGSSNGAWYNHTLWASTDGGAPSGPTYQFEFETPKHLPSSWEESTAAIRWYLLVEVDRSGAPTWEQTIPVAVRPSARLLDGDSSSPVAR